MPDLKTEHDILNEIRLRKASFGVACGKHSGAVTVEVLREELLRRGFLVSGRDVFIRGVPVEWDVVVHRVGATPDLGIVFSPADVLAVIEVKNSGAFGEGTVGTIHSTFAKLQGAAPHISCVYLALAELENYRWAVTDENLGFPAFTLFRYRQTRGIQEFTTTGHWPKFINFLEGLSTV